MYNRINYLTYKISVNLWKFPMYNLNPSLIPRIHRRNLHPSPPESTSPTSTPHPQNPPTQPSMLGSGTFHM